MEETQTEEVQEQAVEETPKPEIDADTIAERVAERMSQQKPEDTKKFDDLDFEDQIKGLKDAQDNLSNAQFKAECKEWAEDNVDSVLEVIPDDYRGTLSRAEERQVAKHLADLVAQNPQQFSKGVPKNIAKDIAGFVVGQKVLSGGKPAPRSVKGEVESDHGIPHYKEIVQGYKELHGKEPTMDDIKRIAKNYKPVGAL